MPFRAPRKRKGAFGSPKPPAGFPQALGNARDLITRGHHEEGLAALSALAAATRNPTKRGKILMLTAESEARLSRHESAAGAYAKAGDFARQAGDLRLLLKASLGRIRSLLAGLRDDDARNAAADLLASLHEQQNNYQQLADTSTEDLANAGSLEIPPQPPRPTVVLTSLAQAFITAGLTADARQFLQRAVQLTPNGASRARQELARLALASDDPAQAERFAREALLMGRFQAKTTAAWKLYLEARSRQNLSPILEPDVLAALRTHAKGRSASSSLLSICRTLRSHGSQEWLDLARAALSAPDTDPVIATELEKILQAEAKLTGGEAPEQIANRALRLLAKKDISPQEQKAHAKEYVRYSLLAGTEPDTSAIVRRATKLHGEGQAVEVLHAMALGAIMAGREDAGRQMLQQLQAELAPGSDPWGKATWALAELEEDTKQFSASASTYLELAGTKNIPAKFRAQAMLRGFKNLSSAGGSSDVNATKGFVSTLLSEVDDHRTALDIARQLALAGPPFRKLSAEAASRGIALADSMLQSDLSVQDTLVIIEYLARKLYWDLGLYHEVISRFDRLDAATRSEMRLVGGNLWYEYLAVVFRSLCQINETARARRLAAEVLDKEQATPEGYVILGSEYADYLMTARECAEAFKFHGWIVKEAPTHRKAAASHYWLAIRALNLGDRPFAHNSATALRKCYSMAPALLDEWELDAAALLIQRDCDLAQTAKDPGAARYETAFLAKQLARMKEHIAGL
jgi:hypothetical protein